LEIMTRLLALLLVTLTSTSCAVWNALGAAPDGARLERMRSSPQYDLDEERFVNELGHMRPEWTTVVGEYMTNDAVQRPGEPLPTDESLAARLAVPPEQGLRVSWIGHSTMLIEVDGKRVLTDPMFSDRASPAT